MKQYILHHRVAQNIELSTQLLLGVSPMARTRADAIKDGKLPRVVANAIKNGKEKPKRAERFRF